MGGDSAVTIEDAVLTQAEPKVFRCGPLIVGCCGTTPWESMWQRLELDPPGTDLNRWVKSYLTDVLKAAIEKSVPKEDVGEVACLIGIGGTLYLAEGDGIPWRIRNNYYAIGTADAANGSLFESEKRKGYSSPRKRILSALKAAEHHTNCVRAPFHVIHT